MQFVSGYATNVGATGEKTSRSSTSCLLGLRWITVTVHSIRSQVNWVDFHRNPHRNPGGKGFAVAQSAIDLNLIDPYRHQRPPHRDWMLDDLIRQHGLPPAPRPQISTRPTT